MQKLSRLGGVSTRTLRYYDEIGILKPARINSSGYRIYGSKEVDMLQQILYYRELGISLDNIKKIITASTFDKTIALIGHRKKLLEKRQQLDLLIETVDKSIANAEGKILMNDKEKFTGFKKKLVDDNEKAYGKEIREKHGDEAVNKSNIKLKKMTQDECEEVTRLGHEVLETLKEAYQTSDPNGELAQKCADLHRRWLSFYWDRYSKEKHANLVQMYVDDERFKTYYDNVQPGGAEFLRDAVFIYTNITKY